MNLAESIEHRENSIISRLRALQAGVDDATGKGSATEDYLEEEILHPYLPAGFKVAKGAVVSTDAPTVQSPAIDRVVYHTGFGAPLVLEPAHSIFPIEVVCGGIEITMRIDAHKLETDVRRLATIRAMRNRMYLDAAPQRVTEVVPVIVRSLGVRCYIIGLPADPTWAPYTIARRFSDLQRSIPEMLVHGLYLLGIGYFETLTVEPGALMPYDIRAWTGPDRLFRFVNAFQSSLMRWPAPHTKRIPHHDAYLDGIAGVYEFPAEP